MEKVNVREKFGLFEKLWTPKIVGELNGQYVKLAKVKGEMVWHSHENEDEMFLVVEGALTLHLRDQKICLNEGEFFIVPRGVEHKPEADEETKIVLFEPKSTAHTGKVKSKLTVDRQVWI